MREVQRTAIGGTQRVGVGKLQVLAPRRLRPIGCQPRLALALTARIAGRAHVALLRGPRTVAARGARFVRRGTYAMRLRLPCPGAYRLKVTSYRPALRRATRGR